jgi:hypothetical protein
MRAGVLVREPLKIPFASQRAFSPAPWRKSLFIAKVTQLSTAPMFLVLPAARGADLAHLERKNVGLANLWMPLLSAHFWAGNSTTTSV